MVFSLTNKVVHQKPLRIIQRTPKLITEAITSSTHTSTLPPSKSTTSSTQTSASTTHSSTLQSTQATLPPTESTTQATLPPTESTTQEIASTPATSNSTPNPASNETSTTYVYYELLSTLKKFFMTQIEEKYFSFFKWHWEALRDHSQKMERIHYQFKYREQLDYDELFKQHTTPFAIPPAYTKIYMGISEYDRRYSKHRYEHPEEYTDPTFPMITLMPFNPAETWPMLNENDTFINSKGEQWDVL